MLLACPSSTPTPYYLPPDASRYLYEQCQRSGLHCIPNFDEVRAEAERLVAAGDPSTVSVVSTLTQTAWVQSTCFFFESSGKFPFDDYALDDKGKVVRINKVSHTRADLNPVFHKFLRKGTLSQKVAVTMVVFLWDALVDITSDEALTQELHRLIWQYAVFLGLTSFLPRSDLASVLLAALLQTLSQLMEWAVGLALPSRDSLTLSQRWITWWFRHFKKGAASWLDREAIWPQDMHHSVPGSTQRKRVEPETMHKLPKSDPPLASLVDRSGTQWEHKFKCQVPPESRRVSGVQQKRVWIYCIARADGAGRDWWVSEAAYKDLSKHQIEPQASSNSPASGSPPAAVRLTREERIAEDEARRNERFEPLAVAHAAENETLKREVATLREEVENLKRQKAALTDALVASQAEVTSLKRHRRNPEEEAGSEMPSLLSFAANEAEPAPLQPAASPVGDFGLTDEDLNALLALH